MHVNSFVGFIFVSFLFPAALNPDQEADKRSLETLEEMGMNGL